MLLCFQGAVTFKVQVPNISDKSDWKCTGQTVELTLPLTDTVRIQSTSHHYFFYC